VEKRQHFVLIWLHPENHFTMWDIFTKMTANMLGIYV